ncbi:Na/Pi cotransporter family protein [Acidisoma cellulosilytica]|uniref:Na/Pi cotransporter family protein n=1 Tax=Acidisoma cellulosilyticum TaxID=2802395 RepID=A0A963YX14_9PROT|nr:Na/Pi cotransporter family protein [Acidisoma cellulosilyticum]MCB8878691.1 Na/Pi cotransporter family protein [Acidisoma cellulosilyticum]
MDLSLTLLQLAGYVALLLWGVHMVQTGVQRAFGAKLRSFLGQALRNRFKAFLAGIGVTAILQSSTATGLMVTGFAAGGLVDLVPALAVMLGANVGTTLIVQLLSFNVTDVAPALILIGVLMFRRATAATRDFGRVFIGLGLVLMALGQFVGLVTPYEDVPNIKLFLGAVANQPLVDVILAAGLTWAAHSSVAVVLLIMSFAGNNVVPPDAAFALVLGANLGTAINPVLEGSTGSDPAARRLPIGNLINRAIGTLIALSILPWLGTLLVQIEPDASRSVADFHTAFNFILAAAFFPFLKTYAALLRKLLPARVDPADPGRPQYLTSIATEAPVIAIGAAAREALRLADVLETMLLGLRDAFSRADRRQITETKQLDDVLDSLNTAIKSYLTGLDTDALTVADHQRVTEILAFATHMEQAGDIVERDLLGIVHKKLRRGLAFSKDGEAELIGIVDRLIANLRAAGSLFMTGDERAARLLAEEKENFRQREAQATAAHFARLRAGRVDTAETSSLHLDALRDLKRVNAHLVAAAAYPVLETGGNLLASRLRPIESE